MNENVKNLPTPSDLSLKWELLNFMSKRIFIIKYSAGHYNMTIDPSNFLL